MRYVDFTGSTITTIAGGGFAESAWNGNGLNAGFNELRGVAISPTSTFALVVDRDNYVVRKIELASPYMVSTFASSFDFVDPSFVTFSEDGSFALISSFSGYVRKAIVSTQVVTTLSSMASAYSVDFRSDYR